MSQRKVDTRDRILAAAEKIAREVGPGNVSLEAVAAAASVSKGGLLYHFPSKGHLLRALVEGFVSEFDGAMRAAEGCNKPNRLINAYVEFAMAKHSQELPPPTGLLAALAEHPDLLDPVRDHDRDLLRRIRDNATDPQLAVIAFLIVQAVRSMDLFGTRVVDNAEISAALEWVLMRLEASSAAA